MSARDCQELKTLTLEWKLANLKHIFDSSQGQAKSKCIRSSPFGDGKWELYFYANSSADYVSLYLSAEPTQEEKDAASRVAAKQQSSSSSSRTLLGSSPSYASLRSSSIPLPAGGGGGPSNPSNTAQSQPQQQHPWIREGSYRFVFEIRPVREALASGGSAKAQPLKMMEAADHVFSSEARNWGWQSFARRSDLYYSNPTSKAFDAFIISCTITYSATAPTPAPVISHKSRLVPAELLDAFAGMFDDPLYSDVRFVIRTRSRRTGRRVERSLYAIRKVLIARSEYFATMFSSGFSEGKALNASQSSSRLGRGKSGQAAGDGDGDGDADGDGDSQMSSLESDDDFAMYESSLDSDGDESEARQEQEQPDGDADDGHRDDAEEAVERSDDADEGKDEQDEEDSDESDSDEAEHTARTSLLVSGAEDDEAPSPSRRGSSFAIPAEAAQLEHSILARVDRYPGLSAAVSPGPSGSSRSASLLTPGTRSPSSASRPTTMRSSSTSGSSNDRRDLSRGVSGTSATSNGTAKANPAGARDSTQAPKVSKDNSRKYIEVVVKDATYSTYRAFIHFLYTDTIAFAPLSASYTHAKDTAELAGLDFPFTSRQKYQQATGQADLHAGTPPDLICSARSIYKLADKLEIPELKARAFDHIVQSLTVETLPYEAFSAFSDQFREIRQVQLDLMLTHWNEVKNGQALRNIFRLVRHDPDRFPGYDELMPAILSRLEFKAPPPGTSPSGVAGSGVYHHQQQHLHKVA